MKGDGSLRRLKLANLYHRYQITAIFCFTVCAILYLGAYYFNDSTKNRRKELVAKKALSLFMSKMMTGEPSQAQLGQSDSRIVDYIWKNKLIEPPSNHCYNLSNPNNSPLTQQEQIIEIIFQNMTNGFFVEAGAFDGETYSNTLFMERHLGWKGLLVEGSPSNYAQLKAKHRKAWTSHTCLSIKQFPHQANFKELGALGKIMDEGSNSTTVKVQCLPLFSLLTALNVSTVDYFSLDVEGSELQVLKTIPFDKVLLKTLSVEFAHTVEGKESLLEFMQSKGYKMLQEIHHDPNGPATDFIFVHNSIVVDHV